MSDYYEYYHKNPHELAPLSDKEEEEMFEEAMYDKIESMEPWEYLDWCSGGEKYDILCQVLKDITLAAYDGDDKAILAAAKLIGKAMVNSIERHVEEEM